MKEAVTQWRIEAAVSVDTVQAFEMVLEPFCDAISWFVTDTGNKWNIEGFCKHRPNAKALADAASDVAAALGVAVPRILISRLEPRDWLGENLQMFPPIDAGRYFIHSTHYNNRVPPGRIGLAVNPGRAFGSGEHATTMGCLVALDWLARAHTFRHVLDMGSGSGILALAAAGTWHANVIAADIDPVATMVSARNARQNGVAGRLRAICSRGYGSRIIFSSRPFDLVVSNILAGPLRRMAGDLAGCLAPGGVAVLSGFYRKDGARVFAAHRCHGMELMRRIDIDGWQTLILRRTGNMPTNPLLPAGRR